MGLAMNMVGGGGGGGINKVVPYDCEAMGAIANEAPCMVYNTKTMDRDGTSVTEAILDVAIPYGATVVSWSPDGNFVAIGLNVSPYLLLYKYSSGTSFVKRPNPDVLPFGAGSRLVWSPDGKYLCYGMSNTYYIAIYKLVNDNLVKVASPTTLPQSTGFYPSWSPESNFLLLAGTGTSNCILYAVNSSNDTFTVSNALTFPASTIDAWWSPNGKYLLTAQSSASAWRGTLYKRPTTTTFSAVTVTNPYPTLSSGPLGAYTFWREVWSKDSKYLLLPSNATTGYRGAVLFEINQTTDAITYKAEFTMSSHGVDSISWFPDNRYVAISSSQYSSLQLVFNDSGIFSTIQYGGGTGQYNTGVSWSPNGKFLAVKASTSENNSGTLVVFLLLNTLDKPRAMAVNIKSNQSVPNQIGGSYYFIGYGNATKAAALKETVKVNVAVPVNVKHY